MALERPLLGMSEILLWADVETTGVGPDCALLEIALLPTTLDSSFVPLGDPYHAVLRPAEEVSAA